MALRNENEERSGRTAVPRRKRRQTTNVAVRVRPMDEQQERRLTTAVDALLAELVRQEMGRARQP
jgi:hypothetical protein